MTPNPLTRAVEATLAAGLPHAQLVMALRLALMCNESPDLRVIVTSNLLDRWNIGLQPWKWALESLVINQLLVIEESRDLPPEHRDGMQKHEYSLRWIAT